MDFNGDCSVEGCERDSMGHPPRPDLCKKHFMELEKALESPGGELPAAHVLQNELLPCPHCGASAEHDSQRWSGRNVNDLSETGHAIYCSGECPVPSVGGVFLFDSFDEAKTWWNTRATSSVPRGPENQLVDQVSEKACRGCSSTNVNTNGFCDDCSQELRDNAAALAAPPVSEDEADRIAQLERQVQGFIKLEDQCYDVLDRLGFGGHILDKVCLARDEIKQLRALVSRDSSSRSGPGEIHGPTRPWIHNKKMLDAIEGVIIEHSGNGLLAQEVRQFISAEDSSSPAAKPLHSLRLSDRLEGTLREEWRKFLTCRPDFDILCGPEVPYNELPADVESDQNKLTGGYQPYPHGRMTERDHMVSAELIQWLGSPVGFAFLTGALERAGWKVSPAVEDIGEVEKAKSLPAVTEGQP